MARSLASEQALLLDERLVHVAIADFRAQRRHVDSLECVLEPEIAHQRADDAVRHSQRGDLSSVAITYSS